MKTILVIDPEKSTLDFSARYLENHGYKVISKLTSSSALDYILDPSIDLILTEVDIKGLNGFDLCLISKRYKSKVPIMFLSSRDDETTKAEALHSGAIGFISKQAEFSLLPHKVSQVLHGQVHLAS